MKFEQYVQLVTSFNLVVLSPMIGYFGVLARQMNETSLIADYGVIILASTMLLAALVQMYAAVRVKLRIYVSLLYINLMLSSFLVLFLIGLLLLGDQMNDYLNSITMAYTDTQRMEIQGRTGKLKMAIIGYSSLAFLMMWGYNGATLLWIGLERVLKTVMPSYFLIEMVYSGFMFITALKIYGIMSSIAPDSSNPLSITMMATGLLLFLAGLAGLLAHNHNKTAIATAALVLVSIANFGFLILGVVVFFRSDLIDEFLGDNWNAISRAVGEDLTPNEYVRWGRMNFKFAGLCYLSFFLLSVPLTVSSFYYIANRQKI